MNSRLLLTFLSLFTFGLCCVDTTIPSPRWKSFYFVWSNFTGGLIIKTYWQNFENLNCLLAWTVVWDVLEYVLGLRELHIVISVVLFVLKFSRSVAQQLRGVTTLFDCTQLSAIAKQTPNIKLWTNAKHDMFTFPMWEYAICVSEVICRSFDYLENSDRRPFTHQRLDLSFHGTHSHVHRDFICYISLHLFSLHDVVSLHSAKVFISIMLVSFIGTVVKYTFDRNQIKSGQGETSREK